MDELLERYAKIPAQLRYLGIAGVFVALFLIDYATVYSSQQSTLAQQHAALAKVEAERAEKRAYAANLARYEARFAQLQESLSTARAQLPDAADVPQLLAQMGDKGQMAGLTIGRFEPKEETEEDFYAAITFDMEVRGSYHEIATFIDSVGKLDRIVNITNMSMTNPKTENQRVVLDTSFVVKTYRFLAEGRKQSKDKDKKK